ncbi:hypothetical protein CFN78_04200 [Amycolatopsis antarctica]|uniref:Uncharacterized protein n=1 Tax=Amycolatopsis antarctica TaxID=1854586 RepID=A0A263D744_9PSEU|nr:Gfo/Idh/MocA family oxidoreductase [Amycolatopsis antarctica]OZM74342.1 hypothetical protein CFN78_04200 [Amycolatopsis antarctica]
MTGRVRVLAAGFGGIGVPGGQDHQTDMYLPALAADPRFEVAGVATAGEDPGRARAAAERYGVVCHESLDAALRADGVDLVCLAAPYETRTEAITAVLEAGRHVLADKPLAPAAADAARLAALADETGVVLVPAHHQRLGGVLRSVRGAVRAGRIGLPWNVQADLLVAGGEPAPGGELANLALHPVDVVLALLGLPVTRVYACGGAAVPEGGHAPVTLLLDHERGVRSTIVCGRLPALRDVPPSAPVVHRYRISGSHGVVLADALKPAADLHTTTGRTPVGTGRDTLAHLLDATWTAVTTGSAELTAWDAVRTGLVLEAAAESLRTGRPAEPARDGEHAERSEG